MLEFWECGACIFFVQNWLPILLVSASLLPSAAIQINFFENFS